MPLDFRCCPSVLEESLRTCWLIGGLLLCLLSFALPVSFTSLGVRALVLRLWPEAARAGRGWSRWKGRPATSHCWFLFSVSSRRTMRHNRINAARASTRLCHRTRRGRGRQSSDSKAREIGRRAQRQTLAFSAVSSRLPCLPRSGPRGQVQIEPAEFVCDLRRGAIQTS